MGGSGALFGMLGVLVVELLQGWKWVQKPYVELFKLIVMIVIALCESYLYVLTLYHHYAYFCLLV